MRLCLQGHEGRRSILQLITSTSIQGLSTRRPSREGAVARLKLWTWCQLFDQVSHISILSCISTYAVAFFPSSSSTKSKACPDWPRSPLEQEDGENDAKGCTERASDEEGAEAVVPLARIVSVHVPTFLHLFKAFVSHWPHLLVQQRFAQWPVGAGWRGYGGYARSVLVGHCDM